jgi:tRNA (guanine-N7-)-methyltransferase
MTVLREWNLKEIVKFKKEDYPHANLEIGSGNGLFLTEIAKSNQQIQYFGIERLAKCINKTKRKAEIKNLKNIILINGDIFTALEKFFDHDFFETIYINFPDPWFKRKHLRKRVVQDYMVQIYHKFLKDNGKLYFVTDNPDYKTEGINSIVKNNFQPVYPEPYYVEEMENYPISLYEEKWKNEGRYIYYSIFTKISKK